jgi:lactoylglutathione lyase
MQRIALFLLLSGFVTSMQAADEVKRPRILGVAHMAIYVSDLQKARAFYKDFLGYEEPYTIKRSDGSDRIAFIKINEDQYLELFAEPPKKDGQLNHISFFTDSAEAMHAYLASRGVKVPDKVGSGQLKNLNFNITDPDGHTVEIVQYQPESWTRREKGRYMPDARISAHIPHIGVLAQELDRSQKFYGDILGFRETWRGSTSGTVLSWVHMRVPDGEDTIELMLFEAPQNSEQMGTKNHVCLVTPDIQKAVAALEARPARKAYGRPIEIRVGRNGKRQANLYDPDGTRIELMEPGTVDGKPVPSSTAPPPIFDPNGTPSQPKKEKAAASAGAAAAK